MTAVAAADQVADAHLMVADAPGERRRDAGELDVELGRADRGLGGFDGGGGDLEIGDPLVVGAGRLEILLAQLGGALELPRSRGRPAPRLRPSCACAEASVAS